MKAIIKVYITVFAIAFVSCKKYVDIPPPNTRLVGASVYSSDATAAAAVTGIYSTMIGNSIGGNFNGISSLLGLCADEFRLYPTSESNLNGAYTNTLLSNLNIPFWSQLYNCIYQANLAIEGLSKSIGVTPSMKQQLMGEAKFVRAFCNFYLVNVFGEVPLITITDYKINSVISRSPENSIYDQIIADLKDAQNLLSDTYLNPNGAPAPNRVRPNKGTATALLARVYLYQQKWDNAEVEATAIINNTNYLLSNNLNTVFLSTNNKEAIWQLESRNNGFNAPDGAFLTGYLGSSTPSSSTPILLSDTLVKYFEPGDLRKTNWTVSKTVAGITYYFPYKYKLNFTGQPPTEYPVLFRLAEQYLIRAEARAQKGNLSGAIADLNVIRARAGLSNTISVTQSDLLAAIVRERRFELFTEYGHRWLDMKRTNTLNSIMNIVTPQKGGTWETSDQLYPIPASEIQLNPNLTQNPGYQ